MKSVSAVALSNVSPLESRSTVQRVSLTAMPLGSNGLPNSGKNGKRLPRETQVSKWMRRPSSNAFITWLVNWFGAVYQRI